MIYERIYLEENNENVYLDTYVADKNYGFVRDAILVIPGGGYGTVCSDREGEPIAMAFIPHGFNAFVLHYSVTSKEKRSFPAQLIQASLAMKHIKDNAERYNIDPNRVFVTGFSAGGHLAASLGVLWHISEVYDAIDMSYGYNKPAGMMLNYPVITGIEKQYSHPGSFRNLFCTDDLSDEQLYKASLEKYVDENSCPAFIFHTAADALVPVKNSLLLADAYAEKGIPFELHIYPNGPHGMALANEITAEGREEMIDTAMEKWIDQAVMWSKKIK
ncbi:MAG: alpha/beta hydrolase [Clostridia bacterium]|nr:alpha/beta hydrolase [Clostridia bacterium]